MLRPYALFAAALLASASVFTISTAHAEPPAAAPTTAPTGGYPLTTCVVSGDKLGEMGDPIIETIDGREVRFCCASCVGEFKKDLVASNKKMDEMIADAQRDSYAAKTCPISGEALGSMGKPVEVVYRQGNQLVKLCCKGCVKKFNADPAAAAANVAAAK